MNWIHAVVTPPVIKPLALADVKSDLDVTFSDDDVMIQSYIDAAVAWVEKETNRFLAPCVVEVYTDGFSTPMAMPFAPVTAFTTMTVSGSSYDPRRIIGDGLTILPSTSYWPALAAPALGDVVVRYSVGYPTGQVPAPLLQAAKLVVSIFYDKPVGNELKTQWQAAQDLIRHFRYKVAA